MAKKDLSAHAQELTAGLFGNVRPAPEAPGDPEPVRGSSDPGNASANRTKAARMPKEGARNASGRKKAVYSARIDSALIAEWNAYQTATGRNAGELLESALRDYLNRNKLTGTQKQVFDLIRQNTKD